MILPPDQLVRLVEVLCWINRVCALCACDPSVHLSVPSIGFVYVFVCQKLSPRVRVCSDSVGLPHCSIPSLGWLMRSLGAEFLRPDDLPGVNHTHGIQKQILTF